MLPASRSRWIAHVTVGLEVLLNSSTRAVRSRYTEHDSRPSWCPSDDKGIAEMVGVGVALSFGSDELPEARKRGCTMPMPGKRRIKRKPRA